MRIAVSGYLIAFAVSLSAQVVHLDVVVRDGRSRIVRNLEAADVVVRENGAEAKVRSIALTDPKQPRLVTLLFDKLSGEPARLAREAAWELIGASSKANVSFGVFEVDATLRVRQSFTTDIKSVRHAVDVTTGRKGELSGKVDDPVTQSVVKASTAIARELRVPPAASALLALIRGESNRPGRKAIVYFSHGLPLEPTQEGFRVLVSSANRAGIAIYAIDASALAISRDEEARRAAATQMIPRVSGDQQAGREAPGGGPPTTVYEQTALSSNRIDGRRNPNTPPSALAVLTKSTSGFLMENGAGFRPSMRRIAEDLTSYYDIVYEPRAKDPDGTFRTTRVELRDRKHVLQGREGYFATPDISGRPVMPFEVALLAALSKPDLKQDFAHRSAVYHFRGEDAKQPATVVAVEVPAAELKFQHDESAGVLQARVSVLAVVRAEDGAVVDRVAGDMPLRCPPSLLENTRLRVVSLQKQLDLPPGKYVLETVAQDRVGERFSTAKTPFTVAAIDSHLGLSSVALARGVTPGGEDRDAGFHLGDKTVQPALEGFAGRGHPASLYFKVYPQAGAVEPVNLAIEVWQGEKRAMHSTKKLAPEGGKPLAQVLALDLKSLPAGLYELRVAATQGAGRAEERTPLVIEGEGEAGRLAEDAELPVAVAEEPKSVPPTAEQQKLLETVRQNALQYSQKLPNFICTQATRRMMDNNGRGEWHTIEEETQLLSFYDGQEHYAPLTIQGKAREGEFPASISSVGEFGSMLKEIFEPASAARFAWVRRDQVRGRVLQVFSYTVDTEHSRYRVTYHGSQQKAPIFSPFHGLVAVDPETAAVFQLTLDTGGLPEGLPIRQIQLALDYDEVAVADRVYLLPITANIDVRLHKRTVARNEVTFRSYQRFSSDSKITFDPR